MDEWDEWNSEELPKTLLEVIEVIGVSAALRLVEGWGGLRLYVPQPESITFDHELAKRLGYEEAVALCEIFAREKLDVPRCKAAARAARDRRMLREHDAGDSARLLAARHGLTERQVWRILAAAGANADALTGDLFA